MHLISKERIHLKPTQPGEIKPVDVAELIHEMGIEPDQTYIRFIPKHRINMVLENGTNRGQNARLWGSRPRRISMYEILDNGYEKRAMDEHGITDHSYTIYLHRGADLLKPGCSHTLDQDNQAMVVYRVHPNIVDIDSSKYLSPDEYPGSYGFYIFKDHPLNHLIGVISSDGKSPSSAHRPKIWIRTIENIGSKLLAYQDVK